MDGRRLDAELLRAFPAPAGRSGAAQRPEELAALGRALSEAGALEGARAVVRAAIERRLRTEVVPEFWRGLVEPGTRFERFERFRAAVGRLADSLESFAPTLDALEALGEPDARERFATIARATLLSRPPLGHRAVVDDFYAVAYDARRRAEDEPDDAPLACAGCGADRDPDRPGCERCERVVVAFERTNRILSETGLLDRLAGAALRKLARDRIESRVRETCKGSFDAPHLAALEAWLAATVAPWLARVRGETGDAGRIGRTDEDLGGLLREAFARARIEQLFNIVIEYPDSQPAVDDLRRCLRSSGAALGRRLRAALETRLLHPGVNTPDILTAYVAAIGALRRLDPSGALLAAVTKPVRAYLRTRDDTVRSVVGGLTEDGPGCELAEELARADDADPDATAGTAGAEDDSAWERWRPDPVDADPDEPRERRGGGDVISMLVNVYGSKELFVNEYRTLLADRLLAQGARNADRERRHLELLKRRFGESQLHFCEVMLKDVSDSKRINGLVRQDPSFEAAAKGFPSNALILSAQFWPPFKDDSLELPAQIRERLEAYTKTFEALKGNRTLDWKPHLGSVDLEIEFGGKTLELSVSPMQATVIMRFQEKPEWRLDELVRATKSTATALRRKMTYWQSTGIISATGADSYALNEEFPPGGGAQTSAPERARETVCEEEDESPMASAVDRREEELQVFWSYIVGMLTNLDSMPLERIHQMLKMFASQTPDAECGPQELRRFLETKVRNHQLIFQGGLYKLPKT